MLFSLWDGERCGMERDASSASGTISIPVDAKRVDRILDTHTFFCSSLEDQVKAYCRPSGTNDSKGIGLWVWPNYVAHCSFPNCFYFFIGDCFVIRASKFIRRGEEVSISIPDQLLPLKKQRDVLQQHGIEDRSLDERLKVLEGMCPFDAKHGFVLRIQQCLLWSGSFLKHDRRANVTLDMKNAFDQVYQSCQCLREDPL